MLLRAALGQGVISPVFSQIINMQVLIVKDMIKMQFLGKNTISWFRSSRFSEIISKRICYSAFIFFFWFGDSLHCIVLNCTSSNSWICSSECFKILNYLHNISTYYKTYMPIFLYHHKINKSTLTVSFLSLV